MWPDALPSQGGEWAWLNRDLRNRLGGAMVASPEDRAVERVIDISSGSMPDFRARTIGQAAFSFDHFASTAGATEGDFTLGLIHCGNMSAPMRPRAVLVNKP